jgi:rSAM/selenodomain-associated transferase 1
MASKPARPGRYLVIMAKSPRLGLVKRRLGAEIGHVAALRFYRNCLKRTCLRLGFDPRWQTLLAATPDRDLPGRDWPRNIPRFAQGGGDLGHRMHRIFATLPPGDVIVIGSDIPATMPSHIAHAFRLLGRSDAVFGPATDGGYWLVGLKRMPAPPNAFAHVRWSGPHALADTLANLDGRKITLAATLSDVDVAAAYRVQRRLAERLIRSCQSESDRGFLASHRGS